MYSADGTAAICPRTPSARSLGDAGYLHKISDNPVAPPPRARPEPLRPVVNWDAMQESREERASEAIVRSHAADLGVTYEALRLLRIGYEGYDVFTFPMSIGGKIAGLRCRKTNGEKWAARHSRNACFVPTRSIAPNEPLFFCEGPTDAAAILSIGLDAIGFACALAGLEHCMPYAKSRVCRIIADADAVGQRGANRLAGLLAIGGAANVRIIRPGTRKDAREWVRAGATADDVLKETNAHGR